MTVRLVPAVGVLAIGLVLGCLGQPAVVATGVGIACGPLYRWRMPSTTVVERTPEDSRTSDVLATQARLDAVILAAESYCRQHGGVYPENFEQMMTLPPAIAKCDVGVTDLIDAWGRPIYYSVLAGHIVVASAGSDGLFTTADDIGRPAKSDPHAETFELPAECLNP